MGFSELFGCNDPTAWPGTEWHRVSNATPLIALDAFVIDTETTGLDPAKARIVEIGAVPLAGGKLDENARRSAAGESRRTDPGAGAHSIHNIDDAAVASAPVFAAVWPDVLRGYFRRDR